MSRLAVPAGNDRQLLAQLAVAKNLDRLLGVGNQALFNQSRGINRRTCIENFQGIDIDDDIWRKALDLTRAAWKPDPARGRITQPSFPSGKGIRETRGKLGGEADRGLLLLYPLSPYFYKDKKPERLIVPGWSKPIMAFAIAFPASDKAIKVEYEVNLLYWMQEYGPSE